jgi:hypothetical protein
MDDLELATADWVWWFNHNRLFQGDGPLLHDVA